MKWNTLSILVLLLALMTACQKNNEEDKLSSKSSIDVVFVEYACCTNLVSLYTNIEGPQDCSPYNLLYANNVAEWNIPATYNYGDTLRIQYELLGQCSMEEPAPDCFILCDIRHGIPIEILAIE
ncbi:MAG: hypothetical protein AAFP19_18125 [Bacteroidota bacterium]